MDRGKRGRDVGDVGDVGVVGGVDNDDDDVEDELTFVLLPLDGTDVESCSWMNIM